MSGTPGGDEIEELLASRWRSSGLDSVTVTPYDVLMSYPNTSNPNTVGTQYLPFFLPWARVGL